MRCNAWAPFPFTMRLVTKHSRRKRFSLAYTLGATFLIVNSQPGAISLGSMVMARPCPPTCVVISTTQLDSTVSAPDGSGCTVGRPRFSLSL